MIRYSIRQVCSVVAAVLVPATAWAIRVMGSAEAIGVCVTT